MKSNSKILTDIPLPLHTTNYRASTASPILNEDFECVKQKEAKRLLAHRGNTSKRSDFSAFPSSWHLTSLASPSS